MKRFLIVLGLFASLLSGPPEAHAQTPVGLMCWQGPPNPQWAPCSASVPLQITGSISASLGGFTPSASGARGTALSVTTSDSSGNLPTGTVVVVSNVGANPMYCNVNGIAATTSDQYISSSGGWFAFTIPAAITTLHCIATGSTTTANMVGGSGLATGTSGGGGSAVTIASAGVASGAYASGSIASGAFASGSIGSGAVASGAVASGAIASGAVASGAYASGAFASGAAASGSWADGAIVTLGAKADAKSTATDTTSITMMQVAKEQSFALQNPATASVSNPTSTLTLPSTTTAYTVGQLICTSPTVATCNSGLASTSFAIGNSAGAAVISRLRLTTNDATSTAWGSQTIQIDLWSAAPTFATTGDRASFTTDFATGTAGHLGAFTCLMSAELADGAYSECYPAVGNAATIKLASGTSVFWTAQAATGSGTTGASKVFTLTPELVN